MANKVSEQSTGWNSRCSRPLLGGDLTWLDFLGPPLGVWLRKVLPHKTLWSRDELRWQGYREEHPPGAISQGVCDTETWRKSRAGPGKCWVSDCTQVTCTHTPCWLPDENVILMDDRNPARDQLDIFRRKASLKTVVEGTALTKPYISLTYLLKLLREKLKITGKM